MKVAILMLLASAFAGAQTEFEAVRKKLLWLDQSGTLRIDDAGVCFAEDEKRGDVRCWRYEDIQHLDHISPTELELLSYEDVAWKLGRDRAYRFELSSGEISTTLFERMAEQVGKASTERVVETPESTEQRLPAKLLTTFGGSEGTLYFSPEQIVYATKAEKRSRQWSLERDVQSVWSSDPYRVEVHVFEGNPGAFRKPRVYEFALKQPLDPGFYRKLKLRLYDIERGRTP